MEYLQPYDQRIKSTTIDTKAARAKAERDGDIELLATIKFAERRGEDVDTAAGPVDDTNRAVGQTIINIGKLQQTVRVSDLSNTRIIQTTIKAVQNMLRLDYNLKRLASSNPPRVKLDRSWEPQIKHYSEVAAMQLAHQAAVRFIVDLPADDRDALTLRADQQAAVEEFARPDEELAAAMDLIRTIEDAEAEAPDELVEKLFMNALEDESNKLDPDWANLLDHTIEYIMHKWRNRTD